jgi:NAD(P)H-hydrate repair Nnr-like enzyme with NAD(P)H-hydrate dehydratase domain
MFAQKYDLVSSVLSAVWLHGRAAEDCYAGITASDIAPAAADILDALRGGEVEEDE